MLRSSYQREGMTRPGKARSGDRRGAAAVEFAVVAPLLFMLVLGMIELGRAVMVAEMCVNASREGARKAALSDMTTSEVETWTKDYLVALGIPQAAVTVKIENQSSPGGGFTTTGDLSAVPAGLGVRVTVTIDFSMVTWLPAAVTMKFMPSNATITAATTMRKERS